MDSMLHGVDLDVDYAQVPPIHQKRSLAFVNHFIMKTVTFLNNFAHTCDSRFMELEFKMQRIEASLLILESKLMSIPELNNNNESFNKDKPLPLNNEKNDQTLPLNPSENKTEMINNLTDKTTSSNESVSQPEIGIKAKNDPRYSKYFKMLQVGVPEPAVKIKMQAEGIDPSILDDENKITDNENLNLNQSSCSDTD